MNEATNFKIGDDGNPLLCCANCIAYRQNTMIPNNAGGDCRLNPPTVIVVQARVANAMGKFEDHIQTLFPPVPSHEFCWKFTIHPALKSALDAAMRLGTNEGKPN